eukprot:COSAG06_NODE_1474_length_9343_cov_29.287322_1_plen_86_part_10
MTIFPLNGSSAMLRRDRRACAQRPRYVLLEHPKIRRSGLVFRVGRGNSPHPLSAGEQLRKMRTRAPGGRSNALQRAGPARTAATAV